MITRMMGTVNAATNPLVPSKDNNAAAIPVIHDVGTSVESELAQDPISFGSDEHEAGAQAPEYQRVSERVVIMGKNMRDRNVKFSGQIRGSGEEFLWLFTKAIKQYGLTEDETFQIIPFILEVPALACSDSQAKLWEEIRARTQGTGESIPEYLTSMQAMFMHFDLDVPMHQQMEIILKNLHPKFIMHIDPRTIHDYDDFAEQGEMVENKLRCMAQYAPPPPPEKSMLPSSAWSRNNSRKAWGMFATETKEEINATESAPKSPPAPSYATVVQTPRVPAPYRRQRIRDRFPELKEVNRINSAEAAPVPLMSLIIPKPANLPPPTDPEDEEKRPRHGPRPTIVPNLQIVGGYGCWRCGNPGHSHRACKAPKRWRYCYLCGWRHVDVTTCPQCKEAWKRSQQTE
ncbi:hypothetical protein PV326_008612 [Microctonus aethiopoides]|nr:hypothetical protein PV326_008612 [Microctonus aethiopoides]